MAKVSLSLATLGDLSDGRARLVIDHAISRAMKDLEDRGDDGKPRKVVVTLEMVKEPNSSAVTMDVTAEFRSPAYRTPATVGNLPISAGEPSLFFQSENATRPDQGTLYEESDKAE